MFFLFQDECEKQIEDLKANMGMIRALIVDNAASVKKWDDGFVPLLCDQYSAMNQLATFLTEVCTVPKASIKSKLTDSEDKILLNQDQMSLLESYSMLLMSNDFDLRYSYRTYIVMH